MTEKYIEYLTNSSKLIKIADHMAYITYPLIQEKRLLLKILNQVYTSLLNILNSVLQYEYLYKRISLYKDSKYNFQTFKEKCAPRYGITNEEMIKIAEIFTLIEKHKNSPFEFVRKDKVVIMSENMKTDTITIEKIKSFILVTKQILNKVDHRVKNKI